MSRHYCEKCFKRRDEKFMKQSPISKANFCFRSIRINFNTSCYEKHIIESIELTRKKLVLLEMSIQVDNLFEAKVYFQGDKSTAEEMEPQTDKNQTNIIDQIEEINNH